MIYFDHLAGTPLLPEAREAMLPFLGSESEGFANPASRYAAGLSARRAVERAREQVAALLGAEPAEVCFVATGSEANNTALKGIASARERQGRHLISSRIEHHSILRPLNSLGRSGLRVTYLDVDHRGRIDPAAVEKAIAPDTILVALALANNEIGTIQPIEEIGRLTQEKGVALHVDAVAAGGRFPIDARALGADTLSIAADQFYGPRGAAALYVRRGVRLYPLIEGGGQEAGRRSGTENVPAVVGMGVAAEAAVRNMERWSRHADALAQRLKDGLAKAIDLIHFTGDPQHRLPGHLSLCIEYTDGEALLQFLNRNGIAAASGAACSAYAAPGVSHVLRAIGLPPAVGQGSLVFSLGKDNQEHGVQRVIDLLPAEAARLQRMSPLFRQASG